MQHGQHISLLEKKCEGKHCYDSNIAISALSVATRLSTSQGFLCFFFNLLSFFLIEIPGIPNLGQTDSKVEKMWDILSFFLRI